MILTPVCRIDYSGDGVSTQFAVPFSFWGPSELAVTVVYADQSATDLAVAGGYAVTGGNGAAGTVNLMTPLALGMRLAIRRQTNRTQASDFVANDDLNSETLERTLDRLTAQTGELTEADGRTIRLLPQEVGGLPALPAVPYRANRLLGFDAAGMPVPFNFPSSATATIPLRINVRDAAYGAIGDGVHEDTAAIQRAFDAGILNSAPIYFPAGHYRCNGAVLQGANALIGDGFQTFYVLGTGSWLIHDDPTKSCIEITGIGSCGVSIDGIAFYQLQPMPAVGWAPTVYPPVINHHDTAGELFLDRVLIAPAYQGVRCFNAGRFTIGDLRGECFSYLVQVDRAHDMIRFGTIHAWPFWSVRSALISQVLKWQQGEYKYTAIQIGRCDGMTIQSLFVFNAFAALHYKDLSGEGPATKITCDNLYADNCVHGLLLGYDGGVFFFGTLTSQGQDYNLAGTAAANADAINIVGYGNRVFITHLYTQMHPAAAVNVAQYNNCIYCFAARFNTFNTSNTSAPAINLTPFSNVPGTPSYLQPNEFIVGMDPRLEGYAASSLYSGNNQLMGPIGIRAPAGSSNNCGLSCGGAGTGLYAPNPGHIVLTGSGFSGMEVSFDAGLNLGHVKSYAPITLQVGPKSSLPPASAYPWAMTMVTDAASSKAIVYSDGNIWRYPDGSTV